ncbi:MAG: DUF5655 domain-containing protein [Fusobacteriaceae bacterium]
MSDIELFRIGDVVEEIIATPAPLERNLQRVIEKNMNKFFGVTFLKSEFVISNGRIDSLGIDENLSPVIFEYKRNSNENIINQGLFYLDWLMDHKADFKLLVMEILGKETAEKIDWSIPSVFCIANDFNKYDEYAVNQMQRNIRLVKYKVFGEDLLLFEHLNSPKKILKPNSKSPIIISREAIIPNELKNLIEDISQYILELGDDVTENEMKHYVAFKKVKNIVCMHVKKTKIFLWLKLDFKDVIASAEGIRDVSNIGHYGTGDVEIIIKNSDDFNRAKPLIQKAYEIN